MGELVFLCHEDQEIICVLEYVNLFLPIFSESLKEHLGAARTRGDRGKGRKGEMGADLFSILGNYPSLNFI